MQIRHNRRAMKIESLLVAERILGTDNTLLRKYIRKAQRSILFDGEFTKNINLLLYLTKLKQDNNEDVDVTYFTELFAEMYNHGIRIDFHPLLESFQKVVNEATRDQYRIQNGEIKYQKNYETDIRVCMYLIGLMLLTYTCKDEEKQIYRAVYRFVQLSTKLQNGFTPLHICCSSRTNEYRLYLGGAVEFPNAHICKTLVKCGANVNAQDKYNNTPLHIIADCNILDDDILRDIINCLVENGAHIDALNINDMTAADVACSSMTESLILGHTKLSLGCLSARVIMEHGIQYKDIISASLYEFVELHGCNRYSSAKMTGTTLVHLGCTSKCTNYY